jgi:uncharacterized protein (DUF2252 family)
MPGEVAMSTEQTDHKTAQDGNDPEDVEGKSDPAKKAAMRASSRAPKVEHFTPAERAARGKAVRAEVPRSSHAEWEPPPHRPDPVELLEEQAQTRVPELVPIRYGRMLVSPFTFFRGAAYLMASDLSGGPRTGLHTHLCGDAHLSNFGVFAAPDRRLIFGLNDFDETLPGPFEWDVKRLVASFAVAGRDRGFDDKTRMKINAAVGRSYREAVQEFGAMRNMDVWYARVDVEDLLRDLSSRASVDQRKRMEKNLAKTRAKDNLKAFAKLTEVVDGEARIVSDPPLIVPIGELAGPEQAADVHDRFRDFIRQYRRTLSGDRRHLLERFRFVDAARKVVGVGSVGTRAWIVLMLGRDGDDPLFMQAKEAQASVLEPFLGKSAFANHGQRVVEGQRLMQAASDIMLGWLHTTGIDGVERDFYIRQLWDAKGSALIESMEPNAMSEYAKVCGWTLAKAHARSGDAIAIGSYLGSSDVFDKAMARFAEAYADQNERDYAALKEAVDSGRVEAETGL